MATPGFSSCAERELRQFLPLFRWLLLADRHDPQEARTKGAGPVADARNSSYKAHDHGITFESAEEVGR
jgi:hypothetical protein